MTNIAVTPYDNSLTLMQKQPAVKKSPRFRVEVGASKRDEDSPWSKVERKTQGSRDRMERKVYGKALGLLEFVPGISGGWRPRGVGGEGALFSCLGSSRLLPSTSTVSRSGLCPSSVPIVYSPTYRRERTSYSHQRTTTTVILAKEARGGAAGWGGDGAQVTVAAASAPC